MGRLQNNPLIELNRCTQNLHICIHQFGAITKGTIKLKNQKNNIEKTRKRETRKPTRNNKGKYKFQKIQKKSHKNERNNKFKRKEKKNRGKKN